jgi:mono/diheme cytochrome c family protein
MAAGVVLAAALWVCAGAVAGAQDDGDPSRGRDLAVRVCAACHGIRAGQDSPDLLAPPFAVIARVRGMSRLALTVALQTSHQAMPNLVLSPDERADVAAYILSLK